MLRRPLTIIVLSFAAGIAAQHIADDFAAACLLLTAGILCGLFFYLIFKCKNKDNIENIYHNKGDLKHIGAERIFHKKLNLVAVIFAVFFLAGCLLGYRSESKISAFSGYFGETVTVKGWVESVKIKDAERYALVVKDEKSGERILVTLKGFEGQAAGLAGRTAEVTGMAEAPTEAKNPGGFDYSLYLRSEKIYACMYAEAEGFKVVSQKLHGFDYINNKISLIKSWFENRLMERFDERAAGMLCGILFGDDTYIDENDELDFQHNGTAHLLAASGLHVGFVYGILNILMKKPVTLAGNLPIIIMLICYSALAGFSTSSVRAVFMVIVYIAGKAAHRRYDFLSSISFCAFALLVYEPMNLMASGFQLSFMAVSALAVVLKKAVGIQKMREENIEIILDDGERRKNISCDKDANIKGVGNFAAHKCGGLQEIIESAERGRGGLSAVRKKARRQAVNIFTVPAALQFGMLPLTVRNFHYISPAGFLLNIPSIAIAGLIVPIGIILMPIAMLSGLCDPTFLSIFTDGSDGLAGGSNSLTVQARFIIMISDFSDTAFMFFGRMAEMLTRLLIWINEAGSHGRFSYIYTASPPAALILFYYFVLFFICSESGTRYLRSFRPALRFSEKTSEADNESQSGNINEVCREKSADIDIFNSQYRSKSWVECVFCKIRAVDIRQAAMFLFPFIAAAIISCAAGFCTNGDYILSDLIFIDVGQGDCAHLKAGGINIMFDSGGSDTYDVGRNVLIPYFLGNGEGKIDLAVMSHLHQDHYGGLKTITEGVKVDKLLLSAVYKSESRRIEAETGIPEKNMIFAKAGDIVKCGEVTLRVLSPEAESDGKYKDILENTEDENQVCLTVQAEYKGKKVLFTGDIDSDMETELCGIWHEKLESDILKVAHHGSRYSTSGEFLEYTKPEVSVIQVGRNLYGHPAAEVLERLEDYGSKIYRNDVQGAVMIKFDKKIIIKTIN